MQHVPVHNRPRGFGRGRPPSTSPGHASPGNNRDVSGSPMEGIPHDPSADTVVESSWGNSLQLTTNEAFTETPDSGSAGTIQTLTQSDSVSLLTAAVLRIP